MKKRRFCSRLREGHPSRAHRTPIHTLVSRIYPRAQVKVPCLTVLDFYLPLELEDGFTPLPNDPAEYSIMEDSSPDPLYQTLHALTCPDTLDEMIRY